MVQAYSDGFYFLPLGGTDGIGMNCYLYGADGDWLMVDCGVSFGDEATPGVDLLMTRPDFVEARKDRLKGIVLTHAHEDHFGAIPYLWGRLKCPVYATPFTAALLRLKLNDGDGSGDPVDIREVQLEETLELGAFKVRFMTVTHSIPEPNALAITSRHGTILHSGDWKLDEDPTLGDPTDAEGLRGLGDKGVLALIGDSTNALVPGHSGREEDAETALTEVIARQSGRVAVTCFASNVSRVQAVARAAHASGRHCAIIGRSLHRVMEAARLSGWKDIPDRFLTEKEASFVPPDKIVLICTGSQGEPRAAMTRIAFNDHPVISLERGDTVLYSAREIPGNEPEIERVQNALLQRGIRVITPDDAPIHVSGHPARDELVQMYQWLRPEVAIPMHGGHKHLMAHAEVARNCQVPNVLIPHDGRIFRLAPGTAEAVGEVQVTRLGLDGRQIIALDAGRLSQRRKLAAAGAVIAVVVIDQEGDLLDEIIVTAIGVEDDEAREALEEALSDEAGDAIDELPRARRRDDGEVTLAARGAIRRLLREATGKKPMVEVRVTRLESA